MGAINEKNDISLQSMADYSSEWISYYYPYNTSQKIGRRLKLSTETEK